MAYTLKDSIWNGRNIVACIMVNQAGTAVVNVGVSGETLLTEVGSSTCTKSIYTDSRSWDGVSLAGSFEGCNTGAFDCESWSADGLLYTHTAGVSCFVAINDGVSAGAGGTNYMLVAQFDQNTAVASSGFGWNASRAPTINRQGLKGTSTSITLPTTGKASVGWVFNANDPDTGYWYQLGESDTASTTMQDTGSVATEQIPEYLRRIQGWDGQAHCQGDLLCLVVFEGKLTGTNFKDLHNDWPGELLNIAPVGGYKPLLQIGNVGNDLYDGTIL